MSPFFKTCMPCLCVDAIAVGNFCVKPPNSEQNDVELLCRKRCAPKEFASDN